jgi:hypothetical protein
MSRYAGAFAPCQPGASTRKNENLILREPLEMTVGHFKKSDLTRHLGRPLLFQ